MNENQKLVAEIAGSVAAGLVESDLVTVPEKDWVGVRDVVVRRSVDIAAQIVEAVTGIMAPEAK